MHSLYIFTLKAVFDAIMNIEMFSPILMDKRLAVPAELRKRVLQCLHSAHQGVGGMKARANETVYWPGMNKSIQDYRDSCGTCNRIAPSLSRDQLF